MPFNLAFNSECLFPRAIQFLAVQSSQKKLVEKLQHWKNDETLYDGVVGPVLLHIYIISYKAYNFKWKGFEYYISRRCGITNPSKSLYYRQSVGILTVVCLRQQLKSLKGKW